MEGSVLSFLKAEWKHRCFLPRFGSLANLFQSRRFLEIDQSETRNACGGHVC
jgi:hypothetical protein